MARAALALIVTVLLVARPAAAAPDAGARVRQHLREGRRLYDEQEYRKAVRELAPIGRDAAATRAQKLEALELLGLCWFILGDEANAREAFEDLLAIDPDYDLREASGSPKIQTFFEKVRKAYLPDYRPDAGVTLDHSAPTSGVAGRRIELSVDVTAGADQVKTLSLYVRPRGQLSYGAAVPFRNTKGIHWRARFDAPEENADTALEYYIEATDIAGRSLARAGSPETPLSIPIKGAPSRERAWYRKWYVWVGAGAAVVGTAAILAATAGESSPDGTLGPGTVDLGSH